MSKLIKDLKKLSKQLDKASSVDKTSILRPSDLKPGVILENIKNPKLGTWVVKEKYAPGLWELRGDNGKRTLNKNELKLWKKVSSVNKTAVAGDMKKKIKDILNNIERHALKNAEVFDYENNIDWAYARAVLYLTAFGKELDPETKKYIKEISRSSDYFSMSVGKA